MFENPEFATVRGELALYYQDNSLEAITDGTYKLIFPHPYLGYGMPGNDGQAGKMVNLKVEECELYDMRRDPGERYNIILQHPEVARRLNEAADRYRRELGDDLTGHKGLERRKPGYRQK